MTDPRIVNLAKVSTQKSQKNQFFYQHVYTARYSKMSVTMHRISKVPKNKLEIERKIILKLIYKNLRK